MLVIGAGVEMGPGCSFGEIVYERVVGGVTGVSLARVGDLCGLVVLIYLYGCGVDA